MNCTSCGKPLRSQYAFRFCPECGAATGSNVAALFHIPVWIKHNRFVKLGALGVAGVVVIGTVAAAMRPGFSSPEKAIEQYYDLLLGGSYGEMKDSVPSKLRDEILSTNNLKNSYVKDQWESVLEDEDYILLTEEVAEVEIRILEEKKNLNSIYGSSGMERFRDSMSGYDTRKGGFDADDITEARYVEYRITLMDEDGNYLEKDDEAAIVFKYKGRWYLADAVEVFSEICEEC